MNPAQFLAEPVPLVATPKNGPPRHGFRREAILSWWWENLCLQGRRCDPRGVILRSSAIFFSTDSLSC